VKFVERSIGYIRQQRDLGDYRFVVPIIVLASSGSYLLHNLHDLNKSAFEIDGLLAISALSGLAVSLAALAYFLFKKRKSVFVNVFLPTPQDLLQDLVMQVGPLHVIAYHHEYEMKKIQSDLVHEIFGDSTPRDQIVWEMFRKNNRKSVALYDDREEEFVGLATVWPLTDRAAADILSGARNETQIIADDLLPPSKNKTAKYCLISALGVKDGSTKLGKQRAVILIKGFKRFFLKEFLGSRASAKTIIAIAEADGRKMVSLSGDGTHRDGSLFLW